MKLLLVLAIGVSACNSATFTGTSDRATGASPAAQESLSHPPAHAKTKGRFTVWTEPEDPAPLTSYKIVIEAGLPASLKAFTVEDLTGSMHGTDQYVQPFGKAALEYDRTHLNGTMASQQEFQFEPGRARLTITIPGAAQLVEDRIDVQSTVLGEKQSLSIVF